MNYAFINNGQVEQYPFGINALRKKFPQTSFPKDISKINLSAYNVVVVEATDPPEFDSLTHFLSEGNPTNVEGIWKQVWILNELTEEQKQEVLLAAEKNEREIRNDLLKDSDWTQLADSSVDKTAWANYRQQLRDIPNQSGFPRNINWPTKP
jgi:hypothetical protein